jgi:glucose/arabinose dehydrogenase
LVEDLLAPTGLAFAPSGFGPYAGGLFIADLGGMMATPAPRDKAPPRNGRILRVAADGRAVTFAQGFASPMGLRFVRHRMIVCDINGDYIGGGVELPDGFVVEITPK